jgi:hypothetical protein
MLHVTTTGARGVLKWLVLSIFPEVIWMTFMCPSARQLGAGTPITILQFAPLAWLHPVLGFYTLNGVCARLLEQGCVL